MSQQSSPREKKKERCYFHLTLQPILFRPITRWDFSDGQIHQIHTSLLFPKGMRSSQGQKHGVCLQGHISRLLSPAHVDLLQVRGLLGSHTIEESSSFSNFSGEKSPEPLSLLLPRPLLGPEVLSCLRSSF